MINLYRTTGNTVQVIGDAIMPLVSVGIEGHASAHSQLKESIRIQGVYVYTHVQLCDQ